MLIDSPPPGLAVRPDPDGVALDVLPYLPDHGAGDLRLLAGACAAAFAAYQVLFGLYAFAAIGAIAAGTAVAFVARMARGARRQATALALTIGRESLSVVETRRGVVVRREVVPLRDVGKVEPVEVGYERYHVVALAAGRAPLRIPMERHGADAAAWVAQALERAARAARAVEDRPEGSRSELVRGPRP